MFHHPSSTLFFGTKKMFLVRLVLSLPQAWNQPFLQSVLIPFSGEEYLETKIWTQGMLTLSGLLLSPSLLQSTELENMYIRMYRHTYTHTHTHTHTHTLHFPSIFISLSVFIGNREFTAYLQFQSHTIEFILVFSLSLFVTLFSDSGQSGTRRLF